MVPHEGAACFEQLGEELEQAALGRLRLPAQESLDHGQGEATLLQVADAPQPVQMGVAVPGDAPLTPWRLEEAFALVEADGVHRHPGCSGQLFDSILHEYLL